MSEAISLGLVSLLWSIGSFAPNPGFQAFKKFQLFKPPPMFLPRDAGEDEGGGLNGLNSLNVLNCGCYRGSPSTDILS
jgi:hypothetical protein